MTAVDLTQLPDDAAEERAILVELSGGPTRVAPPSRRWLIALAAAASIVCMGFAGSVVAPTTEAPHARSEADAKVPSQPAATAPISPASPAAAGGPSPVSLVVPPTTDRLSKGLVPVTIETTPLASVHLSVEVGDAVVGWRNVVAGDDGHWSGSVDVFAPRVALQAVVTATAMVDGQPAEASAVVSLGADTQVVLWESSIAWRAGETATVTLRGSAPLSVDRIRAWVTGSGGGRLGGTTMAPRVDDGMPGSVGGHELGLGSVDGRFTLGAHQPVPLVLHLAWQEHSTSGTSSIEEILAPSIDSGTPTALTRH